MPWYKNWFANDLYMELYAHRDAAEARKGVELFLRLSALQPDDGPVLDLACGSGRHAFELARRGFRVIGVDLSPTLLAAALRKTRKFDSRPLLVRADMRQLPFPRRSFAAVLQLFTAFGYFETDEENASVLRNTSSLLRPGGWYLLDYLNADQVRSTLRERSEQTVGSRVVVMERRLTETRVEKRITLRDNGHTRQYLESVRLFGVEDFHVMFRAAGMTIERILGDYDGAPFTAQSERCIMLARKAS